MKAPQAQYNTGPVHLRRGCTEKTRQQILDELMRWALLIGGPIFFWLCGMAGTGKTTIAYSFCEWLEQKDLLGASFFCSRTLEETRDIKAVFPSIARELAYRSIIPLSELVNVITNDPDIASRPLHEQLTRLILDRIKCKPPLNRPWIVAFDASDEFKTIDDACHFLDTLRRFAPEFQRTNIKFFITSRQEPRLEEVFRRLERTFPGFSPLYLHNIEESLVKDDIKLYLEERRAEIREMKGLQTWFTDEELRVILDNAGKLFIYVSTVCLFLESSDAEECEQNLRVILTHTDIPSMLGQYDLLDTLYRQVLDAIKQDR